MVQRDFERKLIDKQRIVEEKKPFPSKYELRNMIYLENDPA
jgi:hypothetical protein